MSYLSVTNTTVSRQSGYILQFRDALISIEFFREWHLYLLPNLDHTIAVHITHWINYPCNLFEFSLNVFAEFAGFSDKNICHYSKRARTCHPVTSCVRGQDATTVHARYM